MPKRSPHISISDNKLVARVLGLAPRNLEAWPEGVRNLAERLAGEMFLLRYNPFINANLVKKSVAERLEKTLPTLSEEFGGILKAGVETFFRHYDEDVAYKRDVVARLSEVLPPEAIITRSSSLIESATDSTDLRMELPMLMLAPGTIEEIQSIVRLALEMGFSLIPRGGGTGATGGAIPAHTRTVIISMSRFKSILDIDEDNLILKTQAGVITLNAIQACAERGLLLAVDPASKAASSLGGNVSENAGGPHAFEYGVTLDNLLSYTMVTPSGERITVRRKGHPRHKILEAETAVFEILDETGALRETINLKGSEIRGKGLGKDVSNKFLGGLPGVQKEGVDGIIVEVSFILYPKPTLSKTLCLEFYGRSMHNAMLLINDIVGLRDRIRTQGDLVKISSLEEFGPKYVAAINYQRKSTEYAGDPISVLLVQLDSDDQIALDEAVGAIVDAARVYENMDVFVAADQKQADLYWEDRHKLSAIAKRTSGFKINEDIVIPLQYIPEFSAFLENLNLSCLAEAYTVALKKIRDLPNFPEEDETMEGEREHIREIRRGELTADSQNDQELELQIALYFDKLQKEYPQHTDALNVIHAEMKATRVEVATHMHAGDGNCHVNFPANSNDPEMLANVHKAVDKVFAKVMELGGAVSGEHGIGITKIAYLEEEKLKALRQYKREVDPAGLLNPGKLTDRGLRVEPYTFSFNKLIQDLNRTALPDKERLTALLEKMQTCTRCGKCKQVCPMYYPEKGLLFHPRNKILSLGAMVEAVYYSLLHTGKPDKKLLDQIKGLMEHCTACGKCLGVCPVKIDSSKVALHLRAFLEEKHAGGHPIKGLALGWLAKAPDKRLPPTSKVLSVGQKAYNSIIRVTPMRWRTKLDHPVLSGPGPDMDFNNLAHEVGLSKAHILAPEDAEGGRDLPETVFYFPGCGAGLFSRNIGMASLFLLLAQGISIILPEKHLCCGYPLLSQGLEEAWLANYGNNAAHLRKVLERAKRKGFSVSAVLTSCGTCREALHQYGIEHVFGTGTRQLDIMQYLLGKHSDMNLNEDVIYHASCHAEWTGLAPNKASGAYLNALKEQMGLKATLSPGCCGESGLGAMTSPGIYKKLRTRKLAQLRDDVRNRALDTPILVGCPSCKIGIKRSMLEMDDNRPVLHTVEFLAERIGGKNWRARLQQAIASAKPQDGLRFVAISS
ncbi:MAG: FAD-binding and (Fe-S)-binding domain-containing protein [Desulfovibrio sp.]|uniref:FAD-binding and (Fe-S)-binding domain-containing protein n=1 Tax=Desulfovibrio sp. 7SRBS1 TaxID=3378064 RepID=UPI003B3DD011